MPYSLLFPKRKSSTSSNPDQEFWTLRYSGPAAPNINQTLVATSLERVHANTTSTCIVFKADLIKVEGDDKHEFIGICKVGYGTERAEMILHEAFIYTKKLRHLQGKVIPAFFGVYQGMTELPAAIMVLQYVGETIAYRTLEQFPEDYRRRVIDGLLEIHKAGVHHCDFSERNIVTHSDANGTLVPMIVDFGEAEEYEWCPFDKSVKFYTKRPLRTAIDCEEIYFACDKADVWTPRTMLLNGVGVPVEYAVDEDTLLKAGEHALSDVAEQRKKEMLVRVAIKNLRKWYENRAKWDGKPVVPVQEDEPASATLQPGCSCSAGSVESVVVPSAQVSSVCDAPQNISSPADGI